MNSLQIQFEVDRLNASLRDVFRIVVYGNMGNSNATERMIASYDSLLDNLTQRLTERLTDMQHNSSLHDTMESLSHMCFDRSRFEPPPYSIPVIPVRAEQNHTQVSPNVIVTKAEQNQEHQQHQEHQSHGPPTLVVDDVPDNRSPFVKVHKAEPTEMMRDVVTAEVVEEEDENEEDEGEVVEETEEDEAEEDEAEEDEAEEAEETEIQTIRKKKYHVGTTSQIAYAYIDDETMGEEVGVVKDGRVVPRA